MVRNVLMKLDSLIYMGKINSRNAEGQWQHSFISCKVDVIAIIGIEGQNGNQDAQVVGICDKG